VARPRAQQQKSKALAELPESGRRIRDMASRLWRGEHAPWLVVAAVVVLSLAATVFMAEMIEERDQARFENAMNSAKDRVSERMAAYIAALRGGVALFAASQEVTRPDFMAYVRELELEKDYPGIQGIGYARRVPRSEVTLEEASMSRDHGSAVVITPGHARAEYFPIVYIAPLTERNRRAVGYDMYTDSTRREAMERARDSGRPTLTGKVRLLQETDSVSAQAGFLLYLPVYTRGAPPAGTMRAAALRGFVYAPFRADDLFRGIFGSERPRVAFRVYDGHLPDTTRLLHDSDPDAMADPAAHAFADTIPLDVTGHAWTLEFVSLPELEVGSSRGVLAAFLALGLTMAFLLFILTRAQVEARARAERSEAQRSRFFAAMSHELRTPINAIVGYNDLLLAGVFGPMPAEQRHGVERSQKAARHLGELVNDVLDLSKLESGKLKLEIEAVRMDELIDDLLGTIRPMAEERGCAIGVDADPCSHPIRTDPRRVRQILLNLLSNATKFGAGQPIAICCVVRPAGGVHIEVTDGGPGISPENQSRIFEEFVQLEGTDNDTGTGLGLPISRRLAVMLGGTLEVRSEVGQGSTFSLKLPRQTPTGH
jgi:signal transduction histidine kinase